MEDGAEDGGEEDGEILVLGFGVVFFVGWRVGDRGAGAGAGARF
jgi:hypothetical protein